MESMVLKQIRQRIQKTSCLVLGDAMLDRYIYGEVGRISPEAPIPIVNVTGEKEELGGAANVAANLRYFGSITYLCSAIGVDTTGNVLSDILNKKKITYCGLNLKDRITTSKSRVIGKGQQIVRFDEETSNPISLQEERKLMEYIDGLFDQLNLVIISDYAKGVCTPGLCRALISKANSCDIKVVIDPKGMKWDKYIGAYIVTPNWKEFTEIVGPIELEDDDRICKKARMLIEEYQIENLLITRSECGMLLVSKELYLSFPAAAREVADVSGAGDTAIAALAAFLASGVSLKEAVYWANRAAGLAVERVGTSVIGITELIQEQKNGFTPIDYGQKIKSLEALIQLLVMLREKHNVIVFTNGCFDILHMGHIQYLNEAKALGDFLIVAVNTDQSVKRLNKGQKRPINREIDRASQVAALQMVDAVILFDDDTPARVLEQICPDILVKGGDYKLEEIVGSEYAGETKVLSMKEGYSTTCLIEKIQCTR